MRGLWCMSVLVTGIVTSQHLLSSCSVVISEWWEYERGFMYAMGILLQNSNKGQLSFFFLFAQIYLYISLWLIALVNGRSECEETAGHKFKGRRNFSSWLKASDILCSHRLIVILCRLSAQLSPFFECTIANGEPLYPSLKASCVCLEKKTHAKTYLYCLHAFVPRLRQMWCKYLAVALIKTQILYRCLVLSHIALWRS